MKRVMDTLKSNGADESVIKEFQSGAPGAVKKILGNYDNFDLYMGESMDGEAM
jgi:Translationally controlled tumour protein